MDKFEDQTAVSACFYLCLKAVIKDSAHSEAARTLIDMISLLDGYIPAEVYTALAEVVIEDPGQIVLDENQKVSPHC